MEIQGQRVGEGVHSYGKWNGQEREAQHGLKDETLYLGRREPRKKVIDAYREPQRKEINHRSVHEPYLVEGAELHRRERACQDHGDEHEA